MARRQAQDCMFCLTGDCEEHAAKPKATRLPKPVAKPVRERPVRTPDRSLPVADSNGSGQLVQAGNDSASRVRKLQKEAGSEEEEYNQVLASALRSLLPLLAPEDIQSHRELIGPDADKWLRLHRWRRRFK